MSDETTQTVVTQDGRTLPIVPNDVGDRYITFGDGTGAVHTAEGWLLVEEPGND